MRRGREDSHRSRSHRGRGLLLALLILAAVAQPPTGAGAADTQVMAEKITASDGRSLDEFGVDVAVDGDTAIVGAEEDDNANGDNAGAAYIYTRNSTGAWNEQQKLTAGDGSTGDTFGDAVALQGDTAVVGAPLEDEGLDPGESEGGAAYVYTRNATGAWNEQAKLLAGQPHHHAFFGMSVAVDGDTVVAGAPGAENGTGVETGAAYVFAGDGSGTWTQQAKLVGADSEEGDDLGWSVTVDGDTVVAGARFADGGAGLAGAAYVFAGDGSGTWTQQAKLAASDGAGGDSLGTAVALDGDRAMVGAPEDDGDRGSAYVFARNTTGAWPERAKLVADDGAVGDMLGSSATLEGDTALLGAPEASGGAGAAYAYARNATGAWNQKTKLTAGDGAAGDAFGASVAQSQGSAVVGAPNDDNGNGGGAGAVYVAPLEETVEDETQDDAGTDGDASDDPSDPTSIPGGQRIWVNGTLRPQADTVDAYGTNVSENATTSMNFTFDAPAGQNITVRLYDPNMTLVDEASTGPFGGNASVGADAGTGNLTAGTWTTVLELEDPLAGFPRAPSATGQGSTLDPDHDRHLHEGLLLGQDEDDDDEDDYEGERRCDPNC